MNTAILVVDDEQNLVKLLEMVLTKRGYQVHAALTVEDAQRLIDQTAFDLALIDIKIGARDGLSLLDEIRKRRPDTKAIVITAAISAEGRGGLFHEAIRPAGAATDH
jgi:DNA-binding NtrC family response regulator